MSPIAAAAPFKRLGVYVIDVDPEAPENVNVFYEGGALFSSCGEEEFYDELDAPSEARRVFYARMRDLAGGAPRMRGGRANSCCRRYYPDWARMRRTGTPPITPK